MRVAPIPNTITSANLAARPLPSGADVRSMRGMEHDGRGSLRRERPGERWRSGRGKAASLNSSPSGVGGRPADAYPASPNSTAPRGRPCSGWMYADRRRPWYRQIHLAASACRPAVGPFRTAYVSGEESVDQVRLRAHRLGLAGARAIGGGNRRPRYRGRHGCS